MIGTIDHRKPSISADLQRDGARTPWEMDKKSVAISPAAAL
jgi:hypothetical protein